MINRMLKVTNNDERLINDVLPDIMGSSFWKCHDEYGESKWKTLSYERRVELVLNQLKEDDEVGYQFVNILYHSKYKPFVQVWCLD